MQIFHRMYEAIMVILVMFTVITLWKDNPVYSKLNWLIWFIFFIDFAVRLFRSNQKWEFIKKNPLLVIAIIPFDQFFQVARIVRVIYLFRVKTITKYYIQPFVEKLTDQSKVMILLGLVGLLSIESIFVYVMEQNARSLSQSFSYVFGHLMFFGHEIFVVEHPLTIWFLTLTSIIGIALHGLAIQWVFTKADMLYAKWKRRSKRDDSV